MGRENTMTILVDRSQQNNKGRAIGDFGPYFTELKRRAGYMRASEIVRLRFGILVRVKH